MNATGTSDRTDAGTGQESAGVEGTDPGSSEPPEPSHESTADHCGCTVQVSSCIEGVDALVSWLQDRMVEIAVHVGLRAGDVSVFILDDGAMSTLHRHHLAIDGPTDVLTFDLRIPGAPEASIDVDVAVNLDEAGRLAASRGHDPAHELLLYAVHGLLHVLGHDDHDPGAAARMHEREDALIQAIGLPPVFDVPAAGENLASTGASGGVES